MFDDERLESGEGVSPELVADPHQNLVKGLDALAIDTISDMITQLEKLSDQIWSIESRLVKLEMGGRK